MPRWQGASILLAAVTIQSWSWRWLQLSNRELAWSLADLQGVAMDMAVSALVTALLLGLLLWSRVVACGVALCWALINVAGYEYVRVFDAAPTLTYAHYLTDATFTAGSGRHLSYPWLFALLLVVLLISTWRAVSTAPWRASRPWLAGGLLLLFGVGWIGLQLGPQEWRRQHLLQANVAQLWAPAVPQETPSRVAIPRFLMADLDGEPRISLPGVAPNVLLVVLEGVSGAFLPTLTHGQESGVVMPELDALGQQGMLYSRFITQQRQTNRGTYSILCGDLPKLDASMPRMSEIANRGQPVDCLPRLLARAGYHTAYWQAAPLAFMRKDAFMALSGFHEVKGETDLPEANRRTSWGVDDQAFFAQALRRLQALQTSSSPWFMTLMTAGTHHPYNVPTDSNVRGNERQQAFGVLDKALGEFMSALQASGLPENTLILVTSDESSGVAASADDRWRRLTQNWGVLLALPPDIERGGEPIRSPYAQFDISLSVLDYLGLAGVEHNFLGRSLFRDYTDSRPLAMANTYSHQQYLLEDNRLLACREGPRQCRQYRGEIGSLRDASVQEVAPEKALFGALEASVNYSRRPLAAKSGRERFQLMPTGPVALQQRQGNQVLFGGQAWDFPAGTRVAVTLHMELEEGEGVKLHHSLLDAKNGFYHAEIPELSQGEEHALSYQVVFDESAHGVHANLTVEQATEQLALLRVKQAEMVVDWPSKR